VDVLALDAQAAIPDMNVYEFLKQFKETAAQGEIPGGGNMFRY